MGLFEPDQYKTSEKEERRIDRLVLVNSESGSEEIINRAINDGRIIGEAVNFARGLSNEPSCVLTPTELANRAGQTAEQFGLAMDVLDEAKMKELGLQPKLCKPFIGVPGCSPNSASPSSASPD